MIRCNFCSISLITVLSRQFHLYCCKGCLFIQQQTIAFAGFEHKYNGIAAFKGVAQCG